MLSRRTKAEIGRVKRAGEVSKRAEMYPSRMLDDRLGCVVLSKSEKKVGSGTHSLDSIFLALSRHFFAGVGSQDRT